MTSPMGGWWVCVFRVCVCGCGRPNALNSLNRTDVAILFNYVFHVGVYVELGHVEARVETGRRTNGTVRACSGVQSTRRHATLVGRNVWL